MSRSLVDSHNMRVDGSALNTHVEETAGAGRSVSLPREDNVSPYGQDNCQSEAGLLPVNSGFRFCLQGLVRAVQVPASSSSSSSLCFQVRGSLHNLL